MENAEDTLQTDEQSAGRAVPRFQAIADGMRAPIMSGDWGHHYSLPSERRIAEQHGVSRMTARRALEALETNGLVYSEERKGRFVSPPRMTYNVSNMVSFINSAQCNGLEFEIEIIDMSESTADTTVASKLDVAVGEPLFKYRRLFRSSGHPVFVETELVIARLFPNFLNHDLHQSTTSLLDYHYNCAATAGDIVIRMRGVQNHEAHLLGLPSNQSAIELEQVIFNKAGTPFCFGRQLWRGELAEFSAHAIVTAEESS